MKFYQSREWLFKKYIAEKKSVSEIAKMCGVSAMTINRYLDHFGLTKKR